MNKIADLNDHIYMDMKQAAGLLKDDQLVWSSDMESIRKPLSRLLDAGSSLGVAVDSSLLEIARILISEENDFTI